MIFDPKEQEYEYADPRHFTGSARVARMLGFATNPEVNVYRVMFDAGARTAWHIHSGMQLLVVLEGECALLTLSEGFQIIATGGVAVIPPGEKHWHGALPLTPMTHLAINVNATTEWLELATDEDYDSSCSKFSAGS
jgi:4-carboxymuconolactone decarboxylase